MGGSAGFPAALFFGVLVAVAPAFADDPPLVPLRELAGGKARVAWLRRAGPSATVTDEGPRILAGLDARDGKVRILLAEAGEYDAPMFTADGRTILLSDRKANRIFAIDFASGRLRPVRDGQLVELWRDPATGREWLYYKDRCDPGDDTVKADPLKRAPLDDPSGAETAWSTGPIEVHGFQLDASGRKASGLFPWPYGGMADMSAGTWSEVANGCWSSMCPDATGRMWVFKATHRHVQLLDPGAASPRDMPVNTMPGHDGLKVYHPRWSNHPRFITVTGPYRDEKPWIVQGRSPEVFVGRFDESFGRIEAWARITNDDVVDGAPEAWVPWTAPRPESAGPGFLSRLWSAISSPFRPGERWPGKAEGLAYAWLDGSVNNTVPGPGGKPAACEAAPRGKARYGAHWSMDLSGGSFVADEAAAARILAACRVSNELFVEAIVTPDRLEQSGPARIVTFSTDPHTRNFTLGHEGGKLIFRLRTPVTGTNGVNPESVVGVFGAAGEPHHVLVTYRSGSLVAWVDGARTFDTPSVRGDFSNWTPHTLLFGDELTRDRNWAGRVEAVAIGARFIPDDEAGRRWAMARKRLASRRAVSRLVVEAELAEAVPVPSPAGIAPYRRALVAHAFDIRKTVSGKAPSGRILVARWAILDGAVLPGAAPAGGVSRLELEPFDSRPELKRERLVLEVSDPSAPLYFDVSPP